VSEEAKDGGVPLGVESSGSCAETSEGAEGPESAMYTGHGAGVQNKKVLKLSQNRDRE
jgi:hypothetical protein